MKRGLSSPAAFSASARLIILSIRSISTGSIGTSLPGRGEENDRCTQRPLSNGRECVDISSRRLTQLIYSAARDE